MSNYSVIYYYAQYEQFLVVSTVTVQAIADNVQYELSSSFNYNTVHTLYCVFVCVCVCILLWVLVLGGLMSCYKLGEPSLILATTPIQWDVPGSDDNPVSDLLSPSEFFLKCLKVNMRYDGIYTLYLLLVLTWFHDWCCLAHGFPWPYHPSA